MKWHGDDDNFMLNIPKPRAQQQLAIFAIHLSTGCNIFYKRIKLGTIKEYINAVSKLTGLHRNEDVRKDNPVDVSMGATLQAVYKELERWEDEPNRREAMCPAMVRYAAKQAAKATPDSLLDVLSDWFCLGVFAGLRCGEYAQTPTNKRNPAKPDKNIRGDTRAFCLNDIRARTKSGRFLQGAEIASVRPEDILSVWIKFRTQKNGKHGAERLFRRAKGKLCPVLTLYRIIARFIRLRGAADLDTPLSIYLTGLGEILLLTSQEITSEMRTIACAVHNLDPIKQSDHVKRWSAHSLRVGACVFLHGSGFSALDIKWILRWESDAYMVYLRNFHGLSDRQAQAFDHDESMDHMVAMPQLDMYEL